MLKANVIVEEAVDEVVEEVTEEALQEVQGKTPLVQTVAGRLTLVAAFTALLLAMKVLGWWQTGILLALASILPSYRRVFVTLGAICWVYLSPPLNQVLLKELARSHAAEAWLPAWPAAVAAIWLFAGLYGWLVRRFPASPMGRRPVLVLVLVLVGLLTLAAEAPLRGGWWFFAASGAMALGAYIWFFAYWLLDTRSMPTTGRLLAAGYWRPFWGFTQVPFGKGPAYLHRVEARDEEQLAAAQLSGLKLLLWAGVMYVLFAVLNRAQGHDHALGRLLGWLPMGILPTYDGAMDSHLQGHPYALPVRWLVLVLEFLRHVLAFCVWGHVIVATCRMAGFNIAKNTDRPFSATTIAEFFNRVYFYFKELLATFFFYPTFLRYFKRHPRLRMLTATMAAAGLGNVLFHFLRDDGNVFQLGLWQALVMYHPYAVYALILGTAIGISQMRAAARGRQPPPTGWRKARAIAFVLVFYCLMAIFQTPRPSRNIMHYGSYFVSLFWP